MPITNAEITQNLPPVHPLPRAIGAENVSVDFATFTSSKEKPPSEASPQICTVDEVIGTEMTGYRSVMEQQAQEDAPDFLVR